MNTTNIWNELQVELEHYRSNVSSIRRYLIVYEKNIKILINKIFYSSSFEEAQDSFDDLHEIQSRLSTIAYKFEFTLNDRLLDFMHYLDRDDIYSRKYWYDEFRKGLEWPKQD
jgi:hypothetical protein